MPLQAVPGNRVLSSQTFWLELHSFIAAHRRFLSLLTSSLLFLYRLAIPSYVLDTSSGFYNKMTLTACVMDHGDSALFRRRRFSEEEQKAWG